MATHVVARRSSSPTLFGGRHVRGVAWVLVLATSGQSVARADNTAGDTDEAADLFVSGELVAGALVKAQLAAGWGRPHRAWLGGEVLALSTTEFGAMYGGLRANLGFLDATLGLRATAAYDHSPLPVQDRYTDTLASGPAARYASLDASVLGYAPAPRGYAMLWTDLVVPIGLASSERVFEEYQRVVVGSGPTIAARLAYLAALHGNAVLVGPMAEGVWIGGRDATCWRMGGAAFWTISQRWSIYAVLTTPVAGTDDLDAWDSLWGTAGVRYRWAIPR